MQLKKLTIITWVCALSFLLILSGCGGPTKPSLKVAATSVPHAELLEQIEPELRSKGINLEILVIDDFNMPNRAVADGEADANFFQHLPFLENQIENFGYPLEPLVAVHLEPMALYSKKHQAVKEIPDKGTIAIPSDPSNQARALALLKQTGLISLDEAKSMPSLLDIGSNPKNLRFIEMDSPLLSRSLDDVDAAAITTNFALLGGLSPQKDALAVEQGKSRFANIVVIRQGDKNRPEIQALKTALTSDQVRQFIEKKYHGAVIPSF